MTFHWAIPLIAAIACLALAISVNRMGPRSPVSQVFTFLATMLALWNLNFYVLYSVPDRDIALALTRVFRVGALFLPPAVLHLVLVLRRGRDRAWRYFLIADYAVAAGLTVANSMDLFVVDLRRFSWGYYSVGTGLYDVFSLLVAANCLTAFGLLIFDYRTATEPRTRLQLKFWLTGALVALPLSLTNLLPTYGVPIYPLGNLGSAAWAAIVAYAIVRHRLMDIDVVFTKGIAYIAVAVALIVPAFVFILWLQRLSFGRIHPDFSFALLVMLIAVGVLFPSLRLRAESQIERSLFRAKHEYRVVLADFTRSIVRILDRERLLRELTDKLGDTLRVDRLAIALADEGSRSYTIGHSAGVPAATAEFTEDHELVRALCQRDESVLRDELEASRDLVEQAAAKTCLRNGWEVCIPLSMSGRLLGFIGLGRKRNLDAFYQEDLQLLSTLAAEAAIALENARLYTELKRSRDIIERSGRLSALGTLAAGIAHEVRNPLVSIQTFFQLAPQRLHDEEFLTTFLNLTASEVQRISDLITELLTFAKSPTHAVQDLDVNDLIERTILLLQPEARKHRISLVPVLAADLPIIRADGDQVKQVIINLVLNAIQATPNDGTVTVLTRRVTQQNQHFCQIEVRDTGVGIPQKLLEDVFNPFFTTKEKGTGLGLSIAHQIASEHGGFIAVTSEEGRGSSFCVHLPEAPAETDLAEADADLPLRYERLAKG